MVDVDDVIERERESRRTLVKLRQCRAEIEQSEPGNPEEMRRFAAKTLLLAESSLEWGPAVSRQLKRVLTEYGCQNTGTEGEAE